MSDSHFIGECIITMLMIFELNMEVINGMNP